MQDHVIEALARLRADFIAGLPERVAAMSAQLATMETGNPSLLADFHRAAHSLIGSAGIHRLDEIALKARQVERAAKSALEQGGDFSAVRMSFDALVAEVLKPPSPGKPKPLPKPNTALGRRIAIVDDDVAQLGWMSSVLRQSGFRVDAYERLADFRIACEQGTAPHAVIMDMMFVEGPEAGAQIVAELKHGPLADTAVVFVSVRQDIHGKLAAYRAGASHYLTKPVLRDDLLRVIGDVVHEEQGEPYRVLVVDDDVDQLAAHALILRESGINVLECSDPLQVPELLEQFDAETLLLDLYMPNCTGPELAAVLRDDGRYAEHPIIYLSAEQDIGKQLVALGRGGDHFLVKPVSARHLITAVAQHARRYRSRGQELEALRNIRYEAERQQQAMDAHAIIAITDPAGAIRYVNDRFCQVSRFERSELIGRDHRIVSSGRQPREFFEKMWQTISGGGIWQGEICNRAKDGRLFWVETTIVPFLDDADVLYQYISISTDITRIRASEERLRLVVDSTELGTYEWDLIGKQIVTQGSSNFIRRIEKTIAEAFPIELWRSQLHRDDTTLVDRALEDYLAGRTRMFEVEYRMGTTQENTVWILNRGAVVERNADGIPLRMVGTTIDITERKRAEQELAEAKREAEAANRAKNEFLMSMSHELRTPLNAILGFAQLLNLGELSDEARDGLGEIERAGRHLLSLVNDLIDLSRIEAGKLDLSVENVDLDSLVRDVLVMVAPLAHSQNISLTNAVGIGVTVRSDHQRLRQIVLNLAANAIKYNRPQGTVTFFCVPADRSMRLVVEDTGPGIPAEQQSRIFSAFDRLGREAGSIEGTGIGLVISYRLAEAMGGRLGFSSVEGQGSRFWLELPHGSVHVAATTPQRAAVTAGPDESCVPTGQVRRSVLYVEDNPLNMRLMRRIFGMRPALELKTASKAMDGLSLARANPPDLILMDINLPGMNGFEALRELKSDSRTAAIPVIAVTANAMKGDRDACLAAGFSEYLSKPIDLPTILGMLDRVIGQ